MPNYLLRIHTLTAHKDELQMHREPEIARTEASEFTGSRKEDEDHREQTDELEDLINVVILSQEAGEIRRIRDLQRSDPDMNKIIESLEKRKCATRKGKLRGNYYLD